MKIKHLLTKTLLVAAGLLLGGANSVWADDWTTVWTADFSSAPSGMTYSVSNGSTSIANGYLEYHQGGGSGNRALNTAFTDAAFNVDTNWKMEFDWNCSSANTNSSNVAFATNSGTAFTLTWAQYASGVVVTDAASTELVTNLPLLGYNVGSCSSWSHITIIGDTGNGVYLTIKNGETTYVDNVLVSSTFGYPATFNGSLGKAVSHMYIDNVSFATPKVAGFVATPTSTITGASGTSRKFTLSCLTDGATIYYATSDLEKGAAGWTEYTGEVTTSAETIWAYAEDDESNTSDKMNFATGAGTTVNLATPTISASGFTNTTGASVNNPTFTFACDNSAIVGAPTATLSYTFTPDGGVESAATAGTSYTPTGYGTLRVIASADGYDSSEKTLKVSKLYTISYTGRDYTAATHSDDFTTWGEATSVTWDGWASGLTAYLSTVVISDDNHLNIQNANTISLVEGWGWVRGDQKTYGYRVRYAKEGDFIALKENTSKGADADATTYQTVYCNNGTGKNTDLVTITAPAGYAIQQLYHYSATPLAVSATIPTSTYATISSAYALDFANATDGSSAKTLKAYVVSDLSATSATLTEVTEAPANTGIILMGTASETYTIPVLATASSVGTNKLHASVTPTLLDDGTFYVLKGGKFLLVTGTADAAARTVPADKAYLLASDMPPAPAPELTINFGGEATGIADVRGKMEDVRSDFFDLQGRKVAQPAKGLYIVNGKKVVIK